MAKYSTDFLAALSKSSPRDTGVYKPFQWEFKASIQQSFQYPELSTGLNILQ